jgi:hypothetical protein
MRTSKLDVNRVGALLPLLIAMPTTFNNNEAAIPDKAYWKLGEYVAPAWQVGKEFKH